MPTPPAGEVAAAGSSTIAQRYAFTDPKLAHYNTPLAYYRLRQVDLDGSAQFLGGLKLGATGTAVGTLLKASNVRLEKDVSVPSTSASTLGKGTLKVPSAPMGKLVVVSSVALLPGAVAIGTPW